MRLTDLDDDVMEAVCSALRKTRPDGNIFILSEAEREGEPFRVTSTKLVELRNPDEDGNPALSTAGVHPDVVANQCRGLFRRRDL
jgi:hypothetical protein